jgi:hypothetical protein
LGSYATGMCALHCIGIYFGGANYEEGLQDDSKIVMLGCLRSPQR